MSHTLVGHDPKWSARRREIAELPRDVLEAQLISAEINVNRLEIDLAIATRTIEAHASIPGGFGGQNGKGHA